MQQACNQKANVLYNLAVCSPRDTRKWDLRNAPSAARRRSRDKRMRLEQRRFDLPVTRSFFSQEVPSLYSLSVATRPVPTPACPTPPGSASGRTAASWTPCKPHPPPRRTTPQCGIPDRRGSLTLLLYSLWTSVMSLQLQLAHAALPVRLPRGCGGVQCTAQTSVQHPLGAVPATRPQSGCSRKPGA